MKELLPDITQRYLQLKQEVLDAQEHARTNNDFAKAVGEHPQNFAKMERGERAPTIEQLARACDLFGYNANWILLGVSPKMRDKKAEVPMEKRVDKLEQQMRKLQKQLANG